MAVVLCLLAALPAAPAQASTRDKIIQDCADGRLDGTYSPSDLRDARQNLPSDVAEYTDCADLLRRAELPDAPGGTGGTPGGTPGASGTSGPGAPGGTAGGTGAAGGGAPGSFTPTTPEDFAALGTAEAAGGGGSVVAGRRLAPGLSAVAARNDVPGTLIAALLVLLVAGLALAVPGARRALPRAWPLPRRGTAR